MATPVSVTSSNTNATTQVQSKDDKPVSVAAKQKADADALAAKQKADAAASSRDLGM